MTLIRAYRGSARAEVSSCLLPLRATDESQVPVDSWAAPCKDSGGRGRRRAKAQGLGPTPCRAACRSDGLKMRVPVSRPRLLRCLLPVRDEAPVGDLRLTGELHLRLLLRLAHGPRAGPGAPSGAAGLGPGAELEPAQLLSRQRGPSEGVSSSFVSRCQKSTTSLRATATVAMPAPRRALIRSPKALSGLG